MINFKLKDLNQINPAGQEPNLYLSWFWLTDGDLWLQFGNQTIYEYSQEAIQYFGNKLTPYNDYYIVRFLEDFTELFEKISISIPEKFYKLTENLKLYQEETQKWLNIYDADENEYNDFYFNEYDKLISWTYERLLSSAHLVEGPHLSFFRHQDKIRIVWETDYTLENGINLWKAKDGSFEINYSDFINEAKKFGQRFFKAMDKQIELIIEKQQENIQVDKTRLIEEHKERKLKFDENLSYLKYATKDETYWREIEKLYEKMKIEIK